MKFRRFTCPFCQFEGRPMKGTTDRGAPKGMTKLCPACRGLVVS